VREPPAKHKVRFTLDGKPYEVWVTSDMTQLRDAVEQVVARHRRRSEPATSLARACLSSWRSSRSSVRTLAP